jgi:hypothetical protein
MGEFWTICSAQGGLFKYIEPSFKLSNSEYVLEVISISVKNNSLLYETSRSGFLQTAFLQRRGGALQQYKYPKLEREEGKT